MEFEIIENKLILDINQEEKRIDLDIKPIENKIDLSMTDYDDREIRQLIEENTEAIQQLDNNKVDKEQGKGLSTNDYTTQEKNKLANLENYDDTQVKQDITDLKINKANKSEIKTKTSELINDSNFVSDEDYVHTDNNYSNEEKEKLSELENYDDTEIKQNIIDLETNKADKSEIPDVTGFITKDVNNLTYYTLKTNTGSLIDLEINQTTYVVTLSLKDQDGNVISSDTIDLPLENVVVSGSYDSENKKIVLTLQSGDTVDIPVGALVAGLQTEITSQNKLASDLVDDTNSGHKFVTTSEKQTWNGKYDKPSGGIPSTDMSSAVQTSLGKADSAIQSSDLADYVKNTDYATTSKGGVIKQNAGFEVSGSTGGARASVYTYDQYNSAGTVNFIGKGTLENVIEGKGLVSNTDYATVTDAGIVKIAGETQMYTTGAGLLYTYPLSYSQYTTKSNYAIINKGTLENVITGKELVNQTTLDTSQQAQDTKIDNLITQIPTKSVTGNPIYLNDSTDMPLKSFSIEGDTQQGENPTPSNPQEIRNVEGTIQIKKWNEDNTQSKTYNFPLSEGQKLYEGSYLAEDGIHNVRKQVVLNGNETWWENTNYTTNTMLVASTTPTGMKEGTSNILSNIAKYANPTVINSIRAMGLIIGIGLDKTQFSNISSFTTWLSNNPITIEYELAEEEVIPYTSEQQAVIDEIISDGTYKEVTHYTAEATINPDMDIEYRRDLNIVINNLESRLALLE